MPERKLTFGPSSTQQKIDKTAKYETKWATISLWNFDNKNDSNKTNKKLKNPFVDAFTNVYSPQNKRCTRAK